MSLGNLGDLSNLDLGQLQPYLQGVNFPADKEQVASNAESTQRFDSPDQVLQAVQGRL